MEIMPSTVLFHLPDIECTKGIQELSSLTFEERLGHADEMHDLYASGRIPDEEFDQLLCELLPELYSKV